MDQIQIQVKRRRRPALSCIPCRMKKVRCDRSHPICNRCIRGDKVSNCAYKDVDSRLEINADVHGRQIVPASPPIQNSASPDNGSIDAQILPEDGQGKSAQPAGAMPLLLMSRRGHQVLATEPPLGRMTGGLADGENREIDTSSALPGKADLYFPMSFLKSKGSMTRFYGPSFPMNLYSQVSCPYRLLISNAESRQFDGRRNFVKEVKSAYPLIDIIHDGERNHPQRCTAELTGDYIGLVPEQPVVDSLFELYLAYFESRHRIFHVPTLQVHYQEFRNDRQKVDPDFVAQLFLIMATSFSLYQSQHGPQHGFQDEGSGCSRRDTAANWIRAAEALWDRGPAAQLKRPDLVTLQFRCLQIVSLGANSTSTNNAFVRAGNVLRLATSMGYHLGDPQTQASSDECFSATQMRHRIWLTILELDLQISLERGLVPNSHADEIEHTALPLNIDDEALDLCPSSSRVSRPLERFTSMSVPLTLQRSMHARHRICTIINSRDAHEHYNEAMNLDQKLSEELSNIPYLDQHWRDLGGQDDENIRWATAYIRTRIQRSLLALHTCFAVTTSPHPRFSLSQRLRLELAVSLISEALAVSDVAAIPGCIFSEDLFHAALVVCHEVYTNHLGFGAASARKAVPTLLPSLLNLIDDVLAVLEHKLHLLKKGLDQFYVLCIVLALSRSKLSPEMKETYQTQAGQRIIKEAYVSFYGQHVVDSYITKQMQQDRAMRTGDMVGDHSSISLQIRPDGQDETQPSSFEYFDAILENWETELPGFHHDDLLYSMSF